MLELKVRTVHRGRQHVRIKGPYSAPRQAACENYRSVQSTEAGSMLELKVRTVHQGRQHARIKGPYSAPRQAVCEN